MLRTSMHVIWALLLAALAAQNEVRDLERKLAGDREHTWVFARMEVIMGGDGRCKAGETWRFGSNHDVQIRKCQNERLVVSNWRWSVAEESSLDTVLTIGPDR